MVAGAGAGSVMVSWLWAVVSELTRYWGSPISACCFPSCGGDWVNIIYTGHLPPTLPPPGGTLTSEEVPNSLYLQQYSIVEYSRK